MTMYRCILLLVAIIALCTGCATVNTKNIKAAQPIETQQSTTVREPTGPVLKRRVAIARFNNETKYGRGIFADQNARKIGGQASDILTAKLASTGKFLFLDRQVFQDQINDELMLKLVKEGGTNPIAGKIPADYMIIGSVTEFGRRDASDVGVFSRTKKQVAYAKVSMRIIDVSTSQIIYSTEASGEAYSEVGQTLGIGTKASYDSSLNDQAISAAISSVVNEIVANMTEKPWRSYILSMQSENSLIVAGGKNQGIRPGDVFNVYQKGEIVKNPQTGGVIELPGNNIAKISILSTHGNDELSEYSIAQVTQGSLANMNTDNLYIQE